MPSNSSEPTPAARQVRREIRYDAVAAVIAALVGMLALIVAGYTAYIQRQQVRAQVWPFLMMANSDHSSEYMWLNKGVGPARVESLQVFVDGKLQGNWHDVFRSMQLEKLKYGQSTLNGNVLSAGEKVDWLQFGNHDDFLAFREAARRSGFGVKTCYCSTLGDCWINDSTKADWNVQHAVGKCPAVPATQQFDD
jgi:hypothetical protein